VAHREPLGLQDVPRPRAVDKDGLSQLVEFEGEPVARHFRVHRGNLPVDLEREHCAGGFVDGLGKRTGGKDPRRTRANKPQFHPGPSPACRYESLLSARRFKG